MTAIAGIWPREGAVPARASCEAMLAGLSEYGPHGTDLAVLGPIALGRNLFRLLPEDGYDRQPVQARECALVADVRLDNRDDLARMLGLPGAQASVLADADILFRALLAWDDEALQRIVGDYAFAFFDARRMRLLLARDPIGQRPLFWHRSDSFFAFASMPSGLHALGTIPREVDEPILRDFLGHFPPVGGATFYKSVFRVEPGHATIVTPGSVEHRRYWEPSRRQLHLPAFTDYVEAFRAELDQAVESRLRGVDRRVASHLSGGWDSSAVTATAARLLRDRGGRVSAFTSVPSRPDEAGAPNKRFSDEGPLAAATAAFHPNIDHVLVKVGGKSPIASLADYDRWFDRPLATLCNQLWFAAIRTGAREAGTHVVLTGEIGNWTISAAPYYLLADYLRQRRFLAWWREAKAIAATRQNRLRGVLARSFGPWVPDFIWNRVRGLSSGAELELFSALNPALQPEVRRRQEEGRLGLAWRPKDNFAEAVAAMREMDFGQLRKGALAGWGVDERDATADRRLIEFCLSLPTDLLLKDGVRRPLARAALSDRLPPAVLDERRKGYQAADWADGMTADRDGIAALLERIAADPTAAALIDIEGNRQAVRDWPTEGWADWRVIGRYRTALLMSLAAGHFILSAKT